MMSPPLGRVCCCSQTRHPHANPAAPTVENEKLNNINDLNAQPFSRTKDEPMHRTAVALGVCASLAVSAACSKSESSSNPSQPSTSTPVTVSSVAVTGTNSFTEKGATAQLTATATLSNGTSENRTSSATWASDN